MSTISEAENGQQELLGEIRALLHQELVRLLGEQPPPCGQDEWHTFLMAITDRIDQGLPRTRKDVMSLREEFERVIARLRPPDPIDTDRLHRELAGAAQALLDGVAGYGQARDRWLKELERILPKSRQIEKVIVAVHGIGDQSNFGTVQQTARAFCSRSGFNSAAVC